MFRQPSRGFPSKPLWLVIRRGGRLRPACCRGGAMKAPGGVRLSCGPQVQYIYLPLALSRTLSLSLSLSLTLSCYLALSLTHTQTHSLTHTRCAPLRGPRRPFLARSSLSLSLSPSLFLSISLARSCASPAAQRRAGSRGLSSRICTFHSQISLTQPGNQRRSGKGRRSGGRQRCLPARSLREAILSLPPSLPFSLSL